MKQTQVRQLTIRQLHDKLVRRVFAVPKLQREFVWDGTKAAMLFDSIFKNMPIGTILIWETKRKHYDLLRQSLNILPPFDTHNSYGWFLVDGQQRLSVIHEAFVGGQRKISNGKIVDFDRVCFVLEPSEEERQRFVYRKPVPREYLSLKDILSSYWRKHYSGYPKHLLKRINDCRNQILRYRMPLLVTHSEHLEEVREIFLRINSQGMKISTADRAFARASRVDLRDLAHELRAGLNPEFRDLEFGVILQGFAFVTEDQKADVGERALEVMIRRWEKKVEQDGQNSAFFKSWGKYRTAFGKAVDYLHSNFAVNTSGFLPSYNMLATLAVFFYHHPAMPSTKQRREIRKWFWATGVGQRYSGRGYRTNVLDDVKFFSRLARIGKTTFVFTDRIDPQELLRTEYTQRSALANSFFCLLSMKKPCYIENGQPIPPTLYASRANRSDRHHIFPRAMLASKGFRHKEYNSLCNICFIVAEENQKFGMKRPDSYLEPYRKKRHFARAMKSHFIPYTSKSGLFAPSIKVAFRQFCLARMAVIVKAFESEAGIKLFRSR